MRRIFGFLVVAMVGAAVLPVVAGSAPAPDGGGVRPLDVVVSLDHPASPGLLASLHGLGTGVWAAQHIPVAALSIAPVHLGALSRLSGVEGVFPDRTLRYFDDAAVTAVSSADPGPKLPRVIRNDKFGSAIQIPGLGVTGKGVTVAILDSGVDGTHPDLAPAMKNNVKLSPLGSDGPLPAIEGVPDSDTSSGHGTHVAGDVAGRGTASNGLYKGSAPGASLVGLGAGEGLSVNTRSVLQGYDWIVAHRDQYGIRVVNNSFGGSFQPFNPLEPLNKATKAAYDAGIVVVFAQGNDGDEMTMNDEATAPWIIAVAAATQNGGLTDFSSGGLEADVVDATFNADDLAGDPRQPLKMGLYHPSVAALGENVVGTKATGTIVPQLGLRHDVALPAGQQARYTIMSGPSMASPEACGIVALVLEANPALRPVDVKRLLQVTAKPIPDVPFFRQGYGNLDPAAAVGLARELGGKAAADVDRILTEKQAARDAQVLAGINHPLHTTAWARQTPESDGQGPIADKNPSGSGGHTITVDAGTGRLKVLNAGLSLPFVPDPAHTIIVRDAAGKEIARSDTKLPGESGTTIVDLDLTKLTGLTWGKWTIEVTEGGLLPVGFGSDEATVAATFVKAQPADPVSSILPALPHPSK